MNDKATNLFGGKKRIVGFVLALLVIAGGLSWVINRSREPMYEGKPLSYWLECYAPLNRTETSVQEADHAVQAIGTNAIPTLLRMLQKTDSPLKVRLVALLRKQHFVKIQFHPAAYYQFCASRGFRALGSEGRQAVPALINVLKYSDSFRCRIAAVEALTEIGPAAEAAVPALISRLTVNKQETSIIDALAAIHARPELTVPALMTFLTNSDKNVRIQAATVLGSYGSNAQKAIPALEQGLKDADFEVRITCSLALRQIGPKTAVHFEANQRNSQ